MPLIQWDGSLSVRHEIIDAQHRGLITLINRLHDSSVAGKSQDEIKLFLLQLYKYSVFHFGAEEALMNVACYPDKAIHLAEHELFIQKLDSLTERVKAGELDISTETFFWLVDWLLDHIAVTDKKLIACLCQD